MLSVACKTNSLPIILLDLIYSRIKRIIRITLDLLVNKRTILKSSQKMLDFNVYLPDVSSGVFRHSLADSAPSGKTNKIFMLIVMLIHIHQRRDDC